MGADAQGTHLELRRPRDGWPNTCKPEKRPGRKIRKARERLARRIEAFDDTIKSAKGNASAFRRPGSLKCK